MRNILVNEGETIQIVYSKNLEVKKGFMKATCGVSAEKKLGLRNRYLM
jgi:hypothetical protein